jgi:hypothetical protein
MRITETLLDLEHIVPDNPGKCDEQIVEIVYSMMWLIKPTNITTISTMQIII